MAWLEHVLAVIGGITVGVVGAVWLLTLLFGAYWSWTSDPNDYY